MLVEQDFAMNAFGFLWLGFKPVTSGESVLLMLRLPRNAGSHIHYLVFGFNPNVKNSKKWDQQFRQEISDCIGFMMPLVKVNVNSYWDLCVGLGLNCINASRPYKLNGKNQQEVPVKQIYMPVGFK